MSELDELKIIKNEYLRAVEIELAFVDPGVAEAVRVMGQRNYPQGLATRMQLNVVLRKLNESLQTIIKEIQKADNSQNNGSDSNKII